MVELNFIKENYLLLSNYIPSLERKDDVWQTIMDISYKMWRDGKDISYEDMLGFAAVQFGNVGKFAILLGNYNYQVCNGGHAQYVGNDYYKQLKTLINLMNSFNFPISDNLKDYMIKVIIIMKKLNKRIIEYDQLDIDAQNDFWEENESFFKKIDDEYYIIYEDFVAEMSIWFNFLLK